MWKRLKLKFLGWWAAPRREFDLVGTFPIETQSNLSRALAFLAGKVNEETFRGYPPGTLRVESTQVEAFRGEALASARASFSYRRVGWHRYLDARTARFEEIGGGLVHKDRFDAYFAPPLWREVSPGAPSAS